MMAKDKDDTKPTVEDIDRVIRERERKDIAGQAHCQGSGSIDGCTRQKGRKPLGPR
jgi:hypothetical protein